MNTLYLAMLLILILSIFIIVRSINALSKIKVSRQMGVKLSNKNWYYRFLSRNFIKNLPS